jgi:DNA-binding XRE family transcriptional regulator
MGMKRRPPRVAGLTRQAIDSIESNHYLPNATTLSRRVEDLFGLGRSAR